MGRRRAEMSLGLLAALAGGASGGAGGMAPTARGRSRPPREKYPGQRTAHLVGACGPQGRLERMRRGIELNESRAFERDDDEGSAS